MAVVGCSASDLAGLLQLSLSQGATQAICSTIDVRTVGVDKAVLQYLARTAGLGASAFKASDSTSLDVVFLLFSGFLVFLMQAGFAMVSRGERCWRGLA